MSDLIEAYRRHLRSRGFSGRTAGARCIVLTALDRDLPMGLAEATTEELEEFLATPSFARWTRCTYYSHIVGLFRWATHPSRIYLNYDPSAGLVRPPTPRSVPRPVTDDQLVHALEHLGEPWRLYVLLATYAGARCMEIATLRREDITEERIRLNGKGGRVRVLKTHPEIWRAVRHFPAGRIAHTRTGNTPTAKYISVRGSEQLERIGLADVTLHRFRHWYGTTMLKSRLYGGAGASLRVVQENMGHASISTTAGYTAVADEERDAGIDALPTFTTPDPC